MTTTADDVSGYREIPLVGHGKAGGVCVVGVVLPPPEVRLILSFLDLLLQWRLTWEGAHELGAHLLHASGDGGREGVVQGNAKTVDGSCPYTVQCMAFESGPLVGISLYVDSIRQATWALQPACAHTIGEALIEASGRLHGGIHGH